MHDGIERLKERLVAGLPVQSENQCLVRTRNSRNCPDIISCMKACYKFCGVKNNKAKLEQQLGALTVVLENPSCHVRREASHKGYHSCSWDLVSSFGLYVHFPPYSYTCTQTQSKYLLHRLVCSMWKDTLGVREDKSSWKENIGEG